MSNIKEVDQTILWIDVETTGLDAVKQDVIDIAILVEVAGKIVHKEKMSCSPYAPENAHPKALEVNGRTMEQIMSFPPPAETLIRFKEILDMFRETDSLTGQPKKYLFAGYNCSFDIRFIKSWMEKGGDYSYDSYFDYHSYDIFSVWKAFVSERGIKLANNKLSTVCEFLDLPLDAHEAMSDIVATQRLGKKLEEYYAEPEQEAVPVEGVNIEI